MQQRQGRRQRKGRFNEEMGEKSGNEGGRKDAVGRKGKWKGCGKQQEKSSD